MCTRYPIINRVSELKVHIELTRFVQPEKIEIDANERAVNEKSPYCFFVCTTFDSFLNDLSLSCTRSIASTSKIKSRLTAALVINSFESRPADLVTTVTDHPERTGRYHPYVSESLLRDIRSNHTVLGCLPLLFPQCCR